MLLLLPSLVWAESPHLSAIATLTHRSAKPHEHLEMIMSIRNAVHPMVMIPRNLEGLRIYQLYKPSLVTVDGDSVWLFRYCVVPKLIGKYQIDPISVIDGASTLQTQPLFLYVSEKGELPPLSPKELALGVNIPESLSEEVLKAAPQPKPKPSPTPPPLDTRDFGTKDYSWFSHMAKSFWSYPGKNSK